MKVLVLGGGIVGEGIIYALKDRYEITVADISRERLDYLKKRHDVNTLRIDAEKEQLSNVMKGYDVISGTLPGKFGLKVISEACKAGVNVVDNSFMPEDFYTMEDEVKKAEITVIPDSGVAPGLSNMIVGHVASKYGNLENVDIKVGGLPEKNLPPLGYKLLFSPMDTLDEYTRKVDIVRNSKILRAEPGDGIEYFFVNGLGSLEAFYTNGLRSLIRNVKARNMTEKTIRFRGHMEKMKLLMDLGLLSDEALDISGCSVSPKEVLANLLSKNLSFPEVPDILYMEINITATESSELIRYQLFDRKDNKTGFSAMTRTTGFTNAAVTDLVCKGLIKEKGIVAPEIVAMDESNFKNILNFLSSFGVKVTGPDINQ
ncbi:MAG: saccharopine dehydrogenase C-terminal domain-containing protein [Thermoplasmatales archaeon]